MENDLIVENILKERYYRNNESSWKDISSRVGTFLGNNFTERTNFNEAILNKDIIPNSPCLMNAGTDNPMMSACFSIPVEDSIDSIFEAVKSCAIVHKMGGGTGISLSKIRASGSTVHGTSHIASGPCSFIKVFNQATDVIKQGSARRGANLGHLDVNHGDIIEFIKCKSKEGELSNFNISVNINDEFMKNLDLPRNKEVFNLIVEGNWNNGEPGIIFSDAAERDNAAPHLGCLTDTNPCAETRLFPWESCNLASINLLNCCLNGKFEYTKFEELIRLGVNMLDNMIDKNKYPLPQIDIATKKTRKIGLGVMGFADSLIAMGYSYGSSESIAFTNELFAFMREVADNESIVIANKKGSYPASLNDKRRNAATLSIAPTGSISLFAGVSSGIEPNFAYVVKRSTWVDGEKKTYTLLHQLFEQHLNEHYPSLKDSIINWAMLHGTLKNCKLVSDDTRELFITAKDISPTDHIVMQAAIQKHVDQAISKTINCPHETTKSEIAEMIKFAWLNRCKGLTIYREGSRNDVVLETGVTSKSDQPIPVVEITNPVKYKLVTANGRIVPKTPDEYPATVVKKRTACGKLYVIPAEAYGDLHSMFLVNKGGGCNSNLQAIAELIASMLRFGVPKWEITRICKSQICPACRTKKDVVDGLSCPAMIADVILANYPDDEEPPKKEVVSEPKKLTKKSSQSKIVCPECGENLDFVEGCRACRHCGWSKCS